MLPTRNCQLQSLLLAAIVMTAGLPGCSKPREFTLVPADGYVTIQGKPAANVMVQILPDELQGSKGPTSSGVTDEDGYFRLMTFDGREGAVPGPCKVILADLQEERAPQGETALPPRIPAEYSVVGPRGLSVEVKEDGEPIEIDVRG